MKKLLVLDNYDSFTFNLVQLVRENCDSVIEVFRNDEIDLERIDLYDKILLSPGPGLPGEAGILCDLVRRYGSTKSIFGVCLGMQAIAQVFGSKLMNINEPMHGVATEISHTGSGLFRGIPSKFFAGRYHSWVVDASTISSEFIVSALDENNMVMAIEHSEYDLKGVQFHPESILTEYGREIINNFLEDEK